MKKLIIAIGIICVFSSLAFTTPSSTHQHRPFSQCVAMLATGFRCVSDARFGSTYCAFHSYPILLQCVVVINGYPCPKWAVANFKCEDHQNYQPTPPGDLKSPDSTVSEVAKKECDMCYLYCNEVTIREHHGWNYAIPCDNYVALMYTKCSNHGGQTCQPWLAPITTPEPK